MSKEEARDRAPYNKAREAFKKLEMQDKAAFVLEATFSTFGEAFTEAGQQFADVVENVTSEDFFSAFSWETAPGSDADGEEKSGRTKKKASPKSTAKKAKEEDGD